MQNTWLHLLLEKLTFRVLCCLALLVSIALIGIALYMEHRWNLEPCPLCVLQRLCVLLLGSIALLGLLHNPQQLGKKVYAGLAMLPTTAGIVLAARHVWLQNLPKDQLPACGPGLEFILNTFPLFDALKIIFTGSGECGDTQWVFLGLTIPGWTLVIFAVMLLVELMIVSGILRR